jgi:hypothetical protein
LNHDLKQDQQLMQELERGEASHEVCNFERPEIVSVINTEEKTATGTRTAAGLEEIRD